MTWNLENFQRPAVGGDTSAYDRKLAQLVQVIVAADPDLVGMQEVLARPLDLTPASFEDLCSALTTASGVLWHGVTSSRPDQRGIRVGWLARGSLTNSVEVAEYPPGVPPVTVDDDGSTITAAKRGALAITYTRDDGLSIDAVTVHFKSKLLSLPGRRPGQTRFTTNDESERARYGLYALDQRAAEAVTARSWTTTALADDGSRRNVLLCGDLNDTPEAATTQLLLGPPGSQIDTGGFDQPDQGDNNRLWNLGPAMPPGDPAAGIPPANWSRINNGVKELIDQILVSHQLVNALASTEALPLDGIPNVTANPASAVSATAPSDHRPVVARFNL